MLVRAQPLWEKDVANNARIKNNSQNEAGESQRNQRPM